MPSKKNPVQLIRDEKKPTKRQLQANATKEKIYNTAQALFAQYGYDNITVADICKSADVSVGLFYNYFQSKADIPLLSISIIDRYYIECANSFLPTESMQDRFVKLMRVMWTAIVSNEYMLNSTKVWYINEAQSDSPIVFAKDRVIFSILYDILHFGKENNQLRADIDSEAVINMIFTYAIGTCVHLLNEPDREQLIELSCKNLRIICDAISVDTKQ